MKMNYVRALLAFVAIGLLAGCGSMPEPYHSNTSSEAYQNGEPSVVRTEQSEVIQVCGVNPIKDDVRVVTNVSVIRPKGMTIPDLTQVQTLAADSGCDIGEDDNGMPQHLGRVQQAIVATEKFGQQAFNKVGDAATLYVNGLGAAKAIKGCSGNDCGLTLINNNDNANSAEGNGSSEVDIDGTPSSTPPAHGGCDIEGSCGD